MSDELVSHVYFGNPLLTRSNDFWSSLWIDNFSVNYYSDSSEEDLFNYYSQLDPLWSEKEYDNASSWAAGETGIGRWGCALASASMISDHYEVLSPAGEEPTPDVLNEWLINQSDGYIGNGYFNWLAVPRFVREAKNAGNSSLDLEFKRSYYDPVKAYEFPVILGTEGHFVVGHEDGGDEFIIKDPLDESLTSLAKDSFIKSVNRYEPSETDLSYLMFVVNDGFDLKLSSNGESLGILDELEGVVDGVDGEGVNGPDLKVLLLPKPDSGVYKLRVGGTDGKGGKFKLRGYFYDQNGEVKMVEEGGQLGYGDEDEFELSYTKDDLSEVRFVLTQVSLRDLWKSYFETGKIRSRYFYRRIDRYLAYAEKTSPIRVRRIMRILKRYLSRRSRWFLPEVSAGMLERIEDRL